jgi:uncharacterized membrane protein
MNVISRIFIKGLALLTPIAGTILILYWLFSTLEGWTRGALDGWLPEGWLFPGIGIVFFLVIIFAVGILAHIWGFSSLIRILEKGLEKAPLVKAVYGSLKDFSNFMYPSDPKEKKLGKSVMVHSEKLGMTMVGFEMVSDLKNHRLGPGMKEPDQKVAVYLPMSYQIGGYMVIVDRDEVERLDLSAEETLRLTMTAGVTGSSREKEKAESD